MKKLLLLLIVLTLTLVTIGCSSSNSNNSSVASPSPLPTYTPSPTPISSDFMGLEPGLQLTYRESGFEDEKQFDKTFTITTINTTNYIPGVVKWLYDINDPLKGDLILIEGNNYYNYGHCFSDGSEEIYEPPYQLFISNPINPAFEGYYFGPVKGQENVTVPAGTFFAWVFEEKSIDESNEYFNRIWFMPYLGIVKGEYTQKRNGIITGQATLELVSFTKGAPLQNIVTKNIRTQKAQKLKKRTGGRLFRHYNR